MERVQIVSYPWPSSIQVIFGVAVAKQTYDKMCIITRDKPWLLIVASIFEPVMILVCMNF